MAQRNRVMDGPIIEMDDGAEMLRRRNTIVAPQRLRAQARNLENATPKARAPESAAPGGLVWIEAIGDQVEGCDEAFCLARQAGPGPRI